MKILATSRTPQSPGCISAVPIFIAIILTIAISAPARASTQWNLTDADFHSRQVTVDFIDSAGIHIGSQTLDWNDVLELSQNTTMPATISGRFNLIFRGGDKLSGEPLSFDGDRLQWKSAALGPIGFPVDSVLGIMQNTYTGNDLDQTRTDDVVRLANGDTMHGIVTAIAPAGVTIQIGDATPTLSWDSFSAVLFSTPPASPGTGRRMFRVKLVGDENVDAAAVSLAGEQLTITFDDKSTRTIAVNTVQGIEQINGPIEWLTSLRPDQNIYRPMFSENFPARFDHTVADDRPITDKYPGFHHGIGCHSYSMLVYSAGGGWSSFRTQFAVDSDSPLADVAVRIYLDDKLAFHQSGVKAGQIYPVVNLPLAGARTVSLEVDYGQNYATEDRFVWLDPALIRGPPPAATQP
jgi:NPCBM/NEW2 domain